MIFRCAAASGRWQLQWNLLRGVSVDCVGQSSYTSKILYKDFLRSILRELGSLELLGKPADGSERFDHYWVIL
jgi:hypothetical protein